MFYVDFSLYELFSKVMRNQFNLYEKFHPKSKI